jgi:hypothetical protein
MPDTGLTQNIGLTRICGQRDLAIAKMSEAAGLIARGHELADEARDIARAAADGRVFRLNDRAGDPDYRRLFRSFDAEKSATVFTHATDAAIWAHLLDATGMRKLMDVTALNAFHAQLMESPAPVTEDNVTATLEGFHEDRGLIFSRGLATVFSNLDRRFKSHDAFKIGARIILDRVFDGYGSWNYHTNAREKLADVERVLAVLDGQEPQGGELQAAVDADRPGYRPRQSTTESRYLKIRVFKNGNAHLWFTRPDLVKKANLVLADYYGEVLPDAVGPEETFEQAVSKSTALSKDLQFYATPEAVVAELLKGLYVPHGGVVLEPSAGEGAICRGVRKKFPTARIIAVEVDPARAAVLRDIDGVWVYERNFLTPTQPAIHADAVLMNPPFYGTHWMQHVTHAFSLLKPGGELRAVLPVTAQIGESAKHKAFRKWAEQHKHRTGSRLFRSLPPSSFASSGTRINTVILTLHKGRN